MPPDDEFCEAGKGATTFHLFTMTDAARKQLKPGLSGKTVSVKAAARSLPHRLAHRRCRRAGMGLVVKN